MNRVLEDHGTTAFKLSPGSIAHAAIEDIQRHRRNKERSRIGSGEYEHFAFMRQHVRKAIKDEMPAKALIILAIDNRDDGARSGKKATRLIYSDLDLLAGALLLVEKRGKPHDARPDANIDVAGEGEDAPRTSSDHEQHSGAGTDPDG